jgi:hypothetical protein
MKLVAALSLALLAACSRPAPSPTAQAQLASLDGTCALKRAGSPAWESVAAGTGLVRGDRVWLKDGSARILYAAGESQDLRGGTIVEIR